MKLTKRTLTALGLAASYLALAAPVLAQTAPVGTLGQFLDIAAGSAGYNIEGNRETRLATVIGSIVNIFLGLLGLIFVSYTIYGGYLWMTAAGNEEKVAKGKMVISQGVIGMFVILSAWAIYIFVSSVLAGVGGAGQGSGITPR